MNIALTEAEWQAIEAEIGQDRDHQPKWPEPAQIRDELKPVKPLSPAIIPEPLRDWLVDISGRMQCPLDFVAAAALVVTGAVVGAGCGIRPKEKDDWLVVPNLWGGIVGRPSMLKTPSLTEIMKPLTRLEIEARQEYEARLDFHDADHEVYKATREAIKAEMLSTAKGKSKKGATMEDLKNQLTELAEPEAPTRRRFKTNDATIEKIGELLNDNPRGMLLFRDELVGLLVNWEREDRQQDRAFYLESWNGYGSFTCDRIGRGTIDTDNLCVSILGGIQPAKLTGYLYQAADNLKNDGLIQRFQLLVYPDEPTNWTNVDQWPDVDAKNRAFDIFQALAEANFVKWGAELDDGEGIPYFHFDSAAQSVFNDWLVDLQRRLKTEDNPVIEEHLAKYRSLMPSIALLLHLVEIADGTTGAGQVTDRAAIMAAEWCEYLESHARRIYGLLGDVSTRAAAELAKRLKKGMLPDGFTIRDVYRKCWRLLDKKEIVQGAVDELTEAGWLRESISEVGKTTTVYSINPKIFLQTPK